MKFHSPTKIIRLVSFHFVTKTNDSSDVPFVRNIRLLLSSSFTKNHHQLQLLQELIIDDHINSAYHKECIKANRIAELKDNMDAQMNVAISKANKRMIDYVGKLMIQIFVDAKRLSSSAFNWPSRFIAGEASCAYDSQSQAKSVISKNLSLQYVNPPGHLELMTTIIKSHRHGFVKKVNECVALSLRIDGSVDLTQLDKIYVMGKLINLNGSSELVFLGIGQQTQRQANGLMLAVIEALKVFFDDPRPIFQKISSVCTDGANVNKGDKNSLWVLLEKEQKATRSKIPLIKIWCAAHRSELAWKNTADQIGEIGKVLSTLSSIASYFHTSAIRIIELKNVAKDNHLVVLKMPKIFEVRWSQFTFALLRSVLVSWRALVIYFEKNKDSSVCAGYYQYLTQIDNIKLIALLADILFCFKRFQQKLQSDRLTVVSMKFHIDAFKKTLIGLENLELFGGFESKLATNISTALDGKTYLKNIELVSAAPSRRNVKVFSEIRKNILEALRNFLDERFEADELFFKTIEPFISFNKTANIEEVHKLLAPDLSLPSLYLQFQDISGNLETHNDLSINEMILKLSKSDESRTNFKELITVLSRIAACTPHSADVERCISANNILKTKLRARLSLETENKYICIHTNMPDLDDWKPTEAAQLFVAEKSRRQRDVTPSTKTCKKQVYFKGIFPEAKQSIDNEFSDDYEISSDLFNF